MKKTYFQKKIPAPRATGKQNVGNEGFIGMNKKISGKEVYQVSTTFSCFLSWIFVLKNAIHEIIFKEIRRHWGKGNKIRIIYG